LCRREGTLVGKGAALIAMEALNTAATVVATRTITIIISSSVAINQPCGMLGCFCPTWLVFGLKCMAMYPYFIAVCSTFAWRLRSI